ncbi:type II toxin-antitoxin system RelE/ParE family toxin [Tamlana sp. 2_MG-2023]|uniref:type II toxin-antitoxin system RelE/ParE family toxin n=1 Tax=unclassified Tamlana TaxID=2614803 RepID=UPI0026E18932|nr:MULTISPECIES: type II toxin-antitoxin system RelE/ParE family toxin [unclassified Tamlana]MDO6759269.1 type II toxin-antitoxin system RelE/ParE family toxin [Tamlana sp. 2_MG-2023]MDO6790592.1 type II toxin-antitoxin system RelE/ParE family toxin [Tamlana sp. 1_MG-2023]
MLREVVWSPSAEKDFEAVLDYLQLNWDESVTNKFINRVDDIISLIINDLKIFPIINEALEVRKSVVSKHNTLYYRENGLKIEIIRLFDARQDPNKLKF